MVPRHDHQSSSRPYTTPWHSYGPRPKNNHDCNNFKQKAEQEIANLKLEIEKLSFRKSNMDLLLNHFNSKNITNLSKGVMLGDQS
ncbi:hypothetical protein QTP88_007345 [Uroleucon formosanum]